MTPTVLIIEDGDEYRENLTRFVPGPTWIQARSASQALEILERTRVDLIYLDMRFDRIPRADLVGDHAAATRQHYLETNQGLFILNALAEVGSTVPVILAYDFAREAARLKHLQARHPHLAWVPDAVTPEEIRALIERMLRVPGR
jgi:CheY-like chemotaxis protein